MSGPRPAPGKLDKRTKTAIRRKWDEIPVGTLFAAQKVARELGVHVTQVLEVVYRKPGRRRA